MVFSSLTNRIRHSNFRYFIWPIRSYEISKFAPMALLLFFILLNQNLVRGIKDGFIVTLVGTQVISYIKLWVEMPIGLLFVYAYTKLCNIFTTEQVFRMMLLIFMSFFAIFAFIIFPNIHFFHPNPETVRYYTELYPHFKWFVIMWGDWSLVIFYVLGEMWPILILSVFFWQLANKITKTAEASRFYIFFNFFGQTNLLVSGIVIAYLTSGNHILMSLFDLSNSANEAILKSMTLIILISGMIIFLLHLYVEKHYVETIKGIYFKNKRTDILKLSFRESAKMIFRSRYLALICILMISYSTTINLLEGLWMSRIKALYPHTNDFMYYMANVAFWTGVATLIMAFIGNTIIRLFGWFWAAIITPLVTLIVGILFFLGVIYEEFLPIMFGGLIAYTPLYLVSVLGGLQNILSKGAKYSLFDSTKEMTYIPLDKEMKAKGKAAVDVIGAKLGKSIGAFTQFTCFTIFPFATHEDIAGFLMLLFIIISTIWIISVNNLYNHYNKALKIYEEQNIDAMIT